jgi:trypsin-like peptidase
VRLALAIAAVGLLAPSVAAAPAVAPRVVRVTAGGADTARGFVAGPGRVVTVAHVLDRAADVFVDGRRARVVSRDERLDLAVLAAPVDGPRVRVRDADRVVVAGRPATVIRRAQARIDGASWRRPVLELRIEVEDGDSGTPVLTPSGRVAGVIFARSATRPGVAWAVECRVCRHIADKLDNHRR